MAEVGLAQGRQPPLPDAMPVPGLRRALMALAAAGLVFGVVVALTVASGSGSDPRVACAGAR